MSVNEYMPTLGLVDKGLGDMNVGFCFGGGRRRW